MSRAQYSDDCTGWALIRWRGAVTQAIRGRRGQQALRELAAAMDAMPVKRLIAGEFVEHGDYCTLGVLGAARGIQLDDWDSEQDHDVIAVQLNLSEAMIREIEFLNDEGVYYTETPEQRWARMRRWVAEQIQDPREEAR